VGGGIEPEAAGELMGVPGNYAGGSGPVGVRLKGALWMRRGGYIPADDIAPPEAYCQCESTRFDLDAFGRLYVPDIFRFRVTVMDGAGNDLAWFGGYGNTDSRGPGSPVPAPAIAYGWPIAVQVVGDRVYTLDMVNRRVVVARMTNVAAETCPVR
jgi:hypothetical protein